jgi:hypothetical protein
MNYTKLNEDDCFSAYGAETKNNKYLINVAGGGCFDENNICYAYANVEIDLINNNIQYVKYGYGDWGNKKIIKYNNPILIFKRDDNDGVENYDEFDIIEEGDYTEDDKDEYEGFVEMLCY